MSPADQYAASILQSVVSLVSALAWPVLVAVLIFCYRETLRRIFPILIKKLRSAEMVELPGVKLTLAKEVIQQAVQNVVPEPPENKVPESQVMGARKLESTLASAGVSSLATASVVEAQVVQLANEYEIIRSSMSAGLDRTRRMNEVMAKMRTLGIRMLPLLDRMALSQKAGERLAAIASIQVAPDPKYSRWLTERLYVEVPFVFFQATLAISELAQKFGLTDSLRGELQAALDHIRSYPEPDVNTVRFLQQTLAN